MQHHNLAVGTYLTGFDDEDALRVEPFRLVV